MREPGASPGRSRRCKGSCSPATTPLASEAGKAAGEGAPSQKTCRASDIAEPLAEGRIRCFVRPSSSPAHVVAALARARLGGRCRPRRLRRAFPVTITTAAGKVTIQKRPGRIVSLSPTATESLFAIGAGPQVVAVDDQSDYPKAAPKTALSGFTPNVEAIAAYRPDLVVASYDPKGLVSALARLGIPVVLHGPASHFQGRVPADPPARNGDGPRRRGGAGHRRHEGEDRQRSSRRRGPGRTASPSTTRSARTSTRHRRGRSSGRCTRRSASRTSPTPPTPRARDSRSSRAEYIVSSGPDLIVLADTVCCGQKPSTVASRPGWDRISAVRTGSIVRIDDSIASRWGPRLVSFFRAMSSALARL